MVKYMIIYIYMRLSGMKREKTCEQTKAKLNLFMMNNEEVACVRARNI